MAKVRCAARRVNSIIRGSYEGIKRYLAPARRVGASRWQFTHALPALFQRTPGFRYPS